MPISMDAQIGRAKNAVLSYFEQRLSVPRIYIDAIWSGQKLDVLAIDRDGVGDVHAVILFPRKYHWGPQMNADQQGQEVAQVMSRFSAVPAQYKYIGAVDIDRGTHTPMRVPENLIENSFAPDGLGRLGFLSIDVPLDGEPQTKLDLRPERFRAAVSKLADEYVEQHRADWEIRA